MLGPNKSFPSLLDEAILAEAETNKENDMYFPLRPSSAGSCGRKLAWQYAEFTGQAPRTHEERKPHVQRLLDLGHSIEFHAIKQLDKIKSYKLKFKQQVVDMFALPSGRIIEGSTDLVFWNEEHKGVGDIKSVGAKFSSSFQSTWEQDISRIKTMKSVQIIDDGGVWVEDPAAFVDELGEHAIVSNIKQINLYCHSDFFVKRGVNFGSVIRYAKHNSMMFEIRFKPSLDMYKEVEAKYSLIEKTIDEGGHPNTIPQDYVLGSMACAFCPYRSECYPDATKKEVYAAMPKKYWAKRMDEVTDPDELRDLFGPYQAAKVIGESADNLEKKILVALENRGINKIKLDSGDVYEVKTLKSPYPHQELRRSKE